MSSSSLFLLIFFPPKPSCGAINANAIEAVDLKPNRGVVNGFLSPLSTTKRGTSSALSSILFPPILHPLSRLRKSVDDSKADGINLKLLEHLTSSLGTARLTVFFRLYPLPILVCLLVFPTFPRPRNPVDDNIADGVDFEALGAPEVTKSNGAKNGYGEVKGLLSPLSTVKRGMSSALSYLLLLPILENGPRNL